MLSLFRKILSFKQTADNVARPARRSRLSTCPHGRTRSGSWTTDESEQSDSRIESTTNGTNRAAAFRSKEDHRIDSISARPSVNPTADPQRPHASGRPVVRPSVNRSNGGGHEQKAAASNRLIADVKRPFGEPNRPPSSPLFFQFIPRPSTTLRRSKQQKKRREFKAFACSSPLLRDLKERKE